jgi:GDP-L-fucose synthase
MKSDITSQRILVTGGAGFLGGFVVNELKRRGCKTVVVPRRRDYDLIESESVKRLYKDALPEIVIHLAAVGGGIGANRENPGRFFYENLMMGAQLIEQGRLSGVKKFVCISTVCAYPKFTPVPFREEQLWNGYPEETNAPYGLAKRMLLVQLQAYRQQYALNGIYLMPVNLYGPNDDFDPRTSHVIPALIKKCLDAKKEKRDEIVVWGTGDATREFLFVADAAEAIVLATERYDDYEPINIGAGFEISIKDLVGKIRLLTGYDGGVRWDATKPDGQPRRMLDITKAEKYFDFKAKTPFDEGLKKAVAWYEQSIIEQDSHGAV